MTTFIKKRFHTAVIIILMSLFVSTAGVGVVWLGLKYGFHKIKSLQTIHYNIQSQTSINAEEWFAQWDHASFNLGFIQKTCNAIKDGKYDFAWQYQATCLEVASGKK